MPCLRKALAHAQPFPNLARTFWPGAAKAGANLLAAFATPGWQMSLSIPILGGIFLRFFMDVLRVFYGFSTPFYGCSFEALFGKYGCWHTQYGCSP